MSTLFHLTLNTWVPIATNDAHVLQSGGIGKAVYQVSATEPAPYADDQPVYNVTVNKSSFEYRNSQEGLTLWAWLTDGKAQISVTPLLNSGIPDGVYKGFRAQNVQFYDESNKKLGQQWEASRLLTLGDGATLYSVIKTGQYPVDLKKREFAYSGDGVVGNIYASPQYTGGNIDPWYNMRPSQGQPETQLLSSITLVNGNKGTKCGATIHAIGNKSIQGQGNSGASYATNRILEPNSEYLLEILSLSGQDVAARLEIYEGDLDLPLP